MTAQRGPYLLVPEVPQSVAEAYELYRSLDLEALRGITTSATDVMLDSCVIRFGAGLAINDLKVQAGLQVFDAARTEEVLTRTEQRSERQGLRSIFSKSLVRSAMDESCWLQEQARQ
jgi:chorismate mutase